MKYSIISLIILSLVSWSTLSPSIIICLIGTSLDLYSIILLYQSEIDFIDSLFKKLEKIINIKQYLYLLLFFSFYLISESLKSQ